MTSMRQRSRKVFIQDDICTSFDENKFNERPAPTATLYLIFIILFFIYTKLWLVDNYLPAPLMMSDITTNNNKFIAERSFLFLKNLTQLGPRPVGSLENEILAVNLISKEIMSIMKMAKAIHRISFHTHKSNGSFALNFLDGMTNVYKNVQNILVRVGSSKLGTETNSILINCHYDTVIDSPGGYDDGANCAVMLEIFRILTQSDIPFKNDIIFMFNGAEENFMQASHGFVTTHKWAKDVKVVINLESCGAGGRDLLFQAGPENPWLLKTYAETVPYPHANVIIEEIFRSGLFPGDTDFRIFRDFGNITGVDIAWIKNGYLYHTSKDNADQVNLGSLQRMGENILPFTIKLSEMDFDDTNLEIKGKMVYFDVFGTFVFRMSERDSKILNTSILIISLLDLYFKIKRAQNMDGTSYTIYFSQIIFTISSYILTWIFIICINTLYGWFLILLNSNMPWYANPIWILFLYILQTIYIPMAVVIFVSKKYQLGYIKYANIFMLHAISLQTLFTILLAVVLIINARIAFYFGMWIFCEILATRIWIVNTNISTFKRILLYVLLLYTPFTFTLYIINTGIATILPVMGRSGAGNYAELLVAIFCTSCFLICFTFFIPLALVIHNSKKIIKVMFKISVISFMILILTPLGFPYSANPDKLAPQRFIVLHVEKSFNNINNKTIQLSSGFWVVNMDDNSPHSVSNFVPEMAAAEQILNCEKQLYCGLPYSIPVFTLIKKTHWIPAPPPILNTNVFIAILSKTTLSKNLIRYHLVAHGPDHMSIVISPNYGIEFHKWSLTNDTPLKGPTWNNRDTYFIHYSYASGNDDLTFWIDIKVPNNYNRYIMDIAVSGHFVHGPYKTSIKLKKLLAKFPTWTVTSGWVAVFKSYMI